MCEVTGKKHDWSEWTPIYEGYRRKCALLGCTVHEETKDLSPEGLIDLGIFLPEKRGYELGSKGCGHHMWEPWYKSNHGGLYERKCYFCNWWQSATDLQPVKL
jgi:hypothetical protein